MEPLIRQYDGWQDAAPADILAWFQESITTARSNRLNANDLFKLLTTEVTCALAGALDSAGLGLVNLSIASSAGIDFGDDEMQRMLAALAVGNPAFQPYADTLMGLGKTTATRWERNAGPGNPEPPTVEQIAETVAAMKVIDAKALVRAWRDEVLLPLVDSLTNEGKTIEEIKALIVS